jgi:nucleoside-diphosphate-sugar epimerase
MKKILITGPNGYIAKQCHEFLNEKGYTVNFISVRDNNWKNASFTSYDALIHLAAFVHHRENKKNAYKYFSINRDLTLSLAAKAKKEGIKLFIFMSTMNVYDIKHLHIITKETKPNPQTNYGLSKWQAEERLKEFNEDNFKIAIIRPPVVYGQGCKGNYQRLSKFIKLIPIFPNIENKRSMIHIKNLCQLIYIVINHNLDGLFFPQDKEYYTINDLVKSICQIHSKKIRLIKIHSKVQLGLNKCFKLWRKIFTDLVYSKEMSKIDYQYHLISNEEAIKMAEQL